MSYNKLGFTSGQTLKAEHLNYMEDGIANAGGEVFTAIITERQSDDGCEYECNKTFDELVDAIYGGKFIDVREMFICDNYNSYLNVYGLTFFKNKGAPYMQIEGYSQLFWTADGISENSPSGGK